MTDNGFSQTASLGSVSLDTDLNFLFATLFRPNFYPPTGEQHRAK